MNSVQQIKLMQDVCNTDTALQQSKANKTGLNLQTTVGLAAISSTALVADVFDKKLIMTPSQKGGFATKAKCAAVRFNKKIDKLKSFISKGTPQSIKNFLAPEKLQGKIVRKPLELARKSVVAVVKKMANIRGSIKIASLASAALLVGRQFYQSGKIDGVHDTSNSIARADNFARLDV